MNKSNFYFKDITLKREGKHINCSLNISNLLLMKKSAIYFFHLSLNSDALISKRNDTKL